MAVMLLEWVFTSVFLILVVLALRAALGKRMSARLRYALWAVVLVRLLVPVQLFTSPIAGMWVFTESHAEEDVIDWPTAPTAPSNASGDNVLSLGGQASPSAGLTTFPSAPEVPTAPTAPDVPEPPDLNNLPGWVSYLGWAWLAGSAVVVLVFLLSNLRFYWQLRRERIPLDGADHPLRVYVAVGLPSPCLFGVIRPAIYVTPEAAANPDMLRHVLTHEYTHYKHGDHIWNLLRCAALAAHWWNPLVWVSAVLSQRDGELSCDEGALKRLGDGERAAYGSTLLTLVTAKPRPGDLFRCATTMAGDKKSLKERISRIAIAPKRVLWAVVVAVLVTALACVCAFGQAEEVADPEPDLTPAPTASQNVNGVELYKFSADMEDAPIEVLMDAGDFVRDRFEALRDHGIFYGLDGAEAVPDADLPEVDDWRIERLSGPYWSGERYWQALGIGRRVELWNVVYAFHSTTPDKALNLANGATELTGDGWLTPMNYGANYLIYELGEDGSRTLLTDFGEQGEITSVMFRSHLRTKLASLGIPEDKAELYDQKELAEFPLSGRGLPDLNCNGVPELVQVVKSDGGMQERLEVWEGNQLLWSDEAYAAHVGWNAVFLYRDGDGQDYLLRYNPYMNQGGAGYSYRLFTLTTDGQKQVVRENSIDFDINFHPLMHQSFDPEAIVPFMDEINGLLANSVQLINTDDNLLSAFEKEGRLYDSLCWLDHWEPVFTRDENKSLLENLCDYRDAMEALMFADAPAVFVVNETMENAHVLLRYQDKSTQFDADYWCFNYQPPEHVNIQVLDLNGDGKDEIVFPLVWGYGTGAYVEKLYVFDADTLEQYDTSGLNEMILSAIQSTGDEDNFYLSGSGMDVTIPRSEASKLSPESPMADAIAMGNIIRYTVRDGQVFCGLGCDASGSLLNYIGYVNVPVRMTSAGDFACGQAQYIDDPWMESFYN